MEKKVSRLAHYQKTVGANPTPATTHTETPTVMAKKTVNPAPSDNTEVYIDMDIDDILLDKPHAITVTDPGHKDLTLYLYPPSLGVIHTAKRNIDALGINASLYAAAPEMELLRVATTNPAAVAHVIALFTTRDKEEIHEKDWIKHRTETLRRAAEPRELAALLSYVMRQGDVTAIKKRLGIDKENDRMRRVIAAKDRARRTRSDATFGGKSIYGTLIDVACERYGWTFDYVVWGISFANLQLLLADHIQNIYLSDDEQKHIPAALLDTSDAIRADDPANQDRILAMDWK